MLIEITMLKPQARDSHTIEMTLPRIATYLETSSHCQTFLLTRHLLPEDGYLLCCAWDEPIWRSFAWRYFTDIFTSKGVIFHMTSQIQLDEKEHPPS